MKAQDVYGVKPIKTKLENREYSISKMVKTNDEWCPNYPDDEIKLSMMMNEFNGEVTVKIMASGMDDMAVELEYSTQASDYGYFNADRVWKQWKKYIYDRVSPVVDVDWFLERGFLYR